MTESHSFSATWNRVFWGFFGADIESSYITYVSKHKQLVQSNNICRWQSILACLVVYSNPWNNSSCMPSVLPHGIFLQSKTALGLPRVYSKFWKGLMNTAACLPLITPLSHIHMVLFCLPYLALQMLLLHSYIFFLQLDQRTILFCLWT